MEESNQGGTTMEIKKTVWFSGFNIPGVIGVVMGVDTITGKKKAYMGFGTGASAHFDEKMIAANGTPVNDTTFKEVTDFLKS